MMLEGVRLTLALPAGSVDGKFRFCIHLRFVLQVQILTIKSGRFKNVWKLECLPVVDERVRTCLGTGLGALQPG